LLEDELISIADRQIQLASEQQEDKLSEDIAKIRVELSKRGMLRGSTLVLMVQKACAQAISERGEFIWEILFRCIQTIEIEYDKNLEQQLKSIVSKHLPEQVESLSSLVLEAAKQARMQNLASLPDEVGKARGAVLNKIYTEIELFLVQLKHSTPKATPYSPSQVYNFHNSNIGAIQTGSGSTANVTQQVNPQSVPEVLRAFTLIQEKLLSIESLPSSDKSEVIEIVDDGINELKKVKPNISKIKSFISAVGDSISLTADLKPAYEVLKSAALMVGVNLP
jgi:hypothetical protein